MQRLILSCARASASARAPARVQERLPGAKYPDSKPSTAHGGRPAPRSSAPSEPATARGGGPGGRGAVAQSLDDALWRADKENRPNRPAAGPPGGGGGADGYGGGCGGVRLLPVTNDGRRAPAAAVGGYRRL